MTFNNMTMMLPWLIKPIGDDRALLGDYWWPHRVAPIARRSTQCCATIMRRV